MTKAYLLGIRTESAYAFSFVYRSVRTIVNFDAAGSGGPELLFQAGSIEFPMIYATSAPRPHGSVVVRLVFRRTSFPFC
jgi:hypothetical protein